MATRRDGDKQNKYIGANEVALLAQLTFFIYF
jgi:hypothetical protein